MIKPYHSSISIASSTLLALMFIAALPGPAISQELSTDPSPKFKLRATVETRPQLSRSDMTSGSPNNSYGSDKGSIPPEALDMPDVSFNVPPTSSSVPAFSLNALKQDKLPSDSTQTASPQQPDGMMNEYGVDWNKWIAEVADHWFIVLQRMEDQSGMQFHTSGPALISYTAYPDGHIDSIVLKRSSGVPAYDDLQIQALLNSQPTPPFPKGTKRIRFTLVQGWESHPRQAGEQDYQLGSLKANLPLERIRQWINFH